MKIGKTIKPKSSTAKAPKRPVRKSHQGESAGPDERRPEVKADEIYGDTKIPQRGGKK